MDKNSIQYSGIKTIPAPGFQIMTVVTGVY